MHSFRYILLSLSIAAAIIAVPWSMEMLPWNRRPMLRVLPAYSPPVKDRAFLDSEACRTALRFFRANRTKFRNKRYITIIDYTKPSSSNRMYLINMQSGEVRKCLVAHGKNSGWLYATRFSNSPESFQSPRGFFRTGSKYFGKHGPSLELCGLEKGVNDNSLARGIVIHGASYAKPHAVVMNRGRLGRSLGCPAIPAEFVEAVIDRIKDGSFLYIHAKPGEEPRNLAAPARSDRRVILR
ncbi:MAG: murein L,D-transpeptidase catalytic domain family protein [Desulfobacteraceae bacterium]|nr:murein L,D-transpeptidase catalytic domain family protein [Desulfobacteraceae bacterium]